MGTTNWVDSSNHSGPLTAQEAADMVDAGILAFCAGTGPGVYGQYTNQQLVSAKAAGMWQEAYHYIEFGHDPKQWVQDGLTALGGEKPLRGWMNIEQPIQWGTLDDRIDYIQKCFEVADNEYPETGVCTGRWYWADPQYMGNTTAFAYKQLWNAWYDNNPDKSGLPYGGWTTASDSVEQFGGTQIVAGQSVDINYCYRPPRSILPSDPLQALVAKVDGLNAAIIQRLNLLGLAVGTDDIGYDRMQKLYQYAKAQGWVQ